MNNFLNNFIRFTIIGMMIVIFVVGLVLLSYLFIIGAIIGFILLGVNLFTKKYFANKNLSHYHPQKNRMQKKGRTINHEDTH